MRTRCVTTVNIMRKKVVVVGAGFGGLSVVRHLRKAPVDVVLIDKHNYHTFQPLLYQVATAGLEAEEIAHSIRGIFHKQKNFEFCLGEARSVDWASNHVELRNGIRVSFDYLVLAAGGTTNYFGVAGAERYGFALKNLEEAVRLRSHIITCFELADQMRDRFEPGMIHIVVVGGGPTGVEMAGALCELFQKVLRKDYPKLPEDAFRVTLVEGFPHLLNAYHPSSQKYALKQLRRKGVHVMLDRQVTEVTDSTVMLDSGEVLEANTLVWAAGIRANSLAEWINLPTTRGGRVEVEDNLSVKGYGNVFVVGDLAGSQDDEGHFHPQLAPVAMQGGKHVAKEILNALKGKPAIPFNYVNRGTMATIGRNAAVAEMEIGLRTTGIIAWLMWLGLHLFQLVGFRNRLNVLMNWAWNYFTYDRSARLIMPSEEFDNQIEEDDLDLEASTVFSDFKA